MSKDLVDIDAFTSPVHVPEGLDDRDDAAGDVERLAQALANRTRYVKNLADAFAVGAAFRGQPNMFTEQNVFTKTIEGATPGTSAVIRTGTEPNVLGSPWRVIESWKYAGGLYCESYAGANGGDTEGAFLIATNARWDTTSARWTLQNPAHDAVALIWHRGKVRVSRMAHDSGPWASWPVGFAAGALAPADTIVNAAVEGEYLYSSPRQYTKTIDPLAFVCLPGSPNGSGWYGEGHYVEMAMGGRVAHVIRAPHGSKLGICKIKVMAVVGAATVIVKLKRRYDVSMGNILLPSYDDVKVNSGLPLTLNQVTVVATADGLLVDLSFGNMTVSKDEGYLIYVENKSDSVGNVRLYAAELQLTDPGPRNY